MRKIINVEKGKVDKKDHAFQIRLIASVMPMSFVSNSYNPTAVTRVMMRRSQSNAFLALGIRHAGI